MPRSMKANGPTGGPTAWPPVRARCRPAGWPSGWPRRPLRRCGARWTATSDRALEKIYRDLCLFDEHTWGYTSSVASPLRPGNAGPVQRKVPLCLSARRLGEAAPLAAGPHAAGRAGRRACTWPIRPAALERLDYRPRGQPGGPLQVGRGRPVGHPLADRVSFRLAGSRQVRRELPPRTSPPCSPKRPSARRANFWVEQLEGGAVRRLLLRHEGRKESRPARSRARRVATDQNGWPTGASWPEMAKPLFMPGLGDILVVGLRGPAPREAAQAIWAAADTAQRAKMRAEKLEETSAAPAEKTVDRQQRPHHRLHATLAPPALPLGRPAIGAVEAAAAGQADRAFRPLVLA